MKPHIKRWVNDYTVKKSSKSARKKAEQSKRKRNSMRLKRQREIAAPWWFGRKMLYKVKILSNPANRRQETLIDAIATTVALVNEPV